MKIIKLKCSSCGATLEVEEDMEICLCEYCGSKVLIDKGAEYYSHELERTKTAQKHEINKRKAQYEHIKEMEELEKEKEKIRSDNKLFLRLFLFWCFLIILFIILSIALCVYEDHKKRKSEILFEEIEECVQDGNYDEASRLLRQIERNEYYSDEDTIAEYSILIEDARRENNPDMIREIAISRDSSEFTKLTVEEARDLLSSLGFYNIEIVETTEDLFEDFVGVRVESISINGEYDFSEGDEFPDNAEVIIIPEP